MKTTLIDSTSQKVLAEDVSAVFLDSLVTAVGSTINLPSGDYMVERAETNLNTEGANRKIFLKLVEKTLYVETT